jgi:type II secretory pathway pseudopilin PulG
MTRTLQNLRAPCPAETGSILVETLVAIAIVGISLGAFFQSVSGAADRDHSLADRQLALLVAESTLASVGDAIAIAPGRSRGTDHGFDWQVDVTPVAAGDSLAGRPTRVDVSVTAAAAPDHVLARLSTLRLLSDG